MLIPAQTSVELYECIVSCIDLGTGYLVCDGVTTAETTDQALIAIAGASVLEGHLPGVFGFRPGGAAWSGTTFCAVSDTSAFTSPDGITWTQQTMPGNNYYSIVWNGTVFCAIAQYSTTAATSPDGITWTQQTLPVWGIWRSIAWNGTVFCAVSYSWSDSVATSPDGITWTQQTLPVSGNWSSIAWNGTVFCAVSYSGSDSVITSPDGITWTQQTLPVSGYWSSIAWNGTVFCAVSYSWTDSVATSPDGITWTDRSSGLSATGLQVRQVAASGTVFCVTSSSHTSEMYYSTDAISWTKGYMPDSDYWVNMLGANGIFLCFSDTRAIVAISISATNWISKMSPIKFRIIPPPYASPTSDPRALHYVRIS